jgi:hypothetical protein
VTAQSTDSVKEKLLQLLHYEEQLRNAENKKQLAFRAVNDCRQLINFRQAFIFYRIGNKFKLQAASNLAAIDNDAPLVRWLQQQVCQQINTLDIKALTINEVDSEQQQRWNENALPYALWCPLLDSKQQVIGGIWFSREIPWSDEELTLIERIRSAVAYSVLVFVKPAKVIGIHKRKTGWVILALIMIGFFIPIRMSILAPVEVVAHQPDIISSQVEGVIDEIHVMPNQTVSAGQLLISIEDTELRHQVTIAEQELEVKRAHLLTANQGAFRNRESKSSLAILREEITLASTRLSYYQDKLEQASIYADQAGLLIYSDPADWLGRPIQIGERIMLIADPATPRLRVDVPLADSLSLMPGSDVKVFLNADPLSAINATLVNAAYEAEEVIAGQLAYRVIATANSQKDLNDLRIGFRGTAKIYGGSVPLWYYFFRRPITSIRQYLGW